MREEIGEIETKLLAIQLRMPTGEQACTQLPITVLSDSLRTRRAFRAFGFAFAVGAVLIVVPLMHLIGPLVSWITAGVLLVRRLSERERLLECKVVCPKCGGEAHIAEQRVQWPIVTVCSSCKWQITCVPAAAVTAHETGVSSARV